MSTTRVPPSTKEVLAKQALDAKQRRQATRAASPAAPTNTAIVPVPPQAIAVPDTRTSVQQYLDGIAPAMIVGRLIRFSKEGTFITHDDGEVVPDDAVFVAHCDQTLIGWVKFNDDAKPNYIMGLLYDGFVMPARETLDERDQTEWATGLNGKPEDPWKHQMYLILENRATREMFTFATTSDTGRSRVGGLLQHYNRVRRRRPDDLPLIRLKPGGFWSKDKQIGWVKTPGFDIVGEAPRTSATQPDTSTQTHMNDKIPF